MTQRWLGVALAMVLVCCSDDDAVLDAGADFGSGRDGSVDTPDAEEPDGAAADGGPVDDALTPDTGTPVDAASDAPMDAYPMDVGADLVVMDQGVDQGIEEDAAMPPSYYAPFETVTGSTSCQFGDCTVSGWRGAENSTCEFRECFERGWSGTTPDGERYATRCELMDCAGRGWTTQAAGETTTTSCMFGACFTNGWQTRYPDGSQTMTRCNFGDCATRGWTVTDANGTRSCSCMFSDCWSRGWTCN